MESVPIGQQWPREPVSGTLGGVMGSRHLVVTGSGASPLEWGNPGWVADIFVTSGPPSSTKNIVELYAMADESAWLGSVRVGKTILVSREDEKCSVRFGGDRLVVNVLGHASLGSADGSYTKASVGEECVRPLK
ncbi:hypothetical protein GW17_00032925 [Ensete ventricosum]|nr:hypothetical protein GW17_00032925 [Ensete ventricosum]